VIDLHSHTFESDGTLSPNDLIRLAREIGVRVLSITDHDTFAGYDGALDVAREAGIELICGIELSTRLRGSSTHLLGYFPSEQPSSSFRTWILDLQASRRERNLRLVARLRQLGIDVTIEEVQARGRSMTGRPHFAQVMVEKGYVQTPQQAFDEYLDESAKGYVHRREPAFEEAVSRIRSAGGVASLAHPIRVRTNVEALLPELAEAGLNAVEAYHSDHSPEDTERYLALARRHDLLVTGGSDFHGAIKPAIALGTGRGGNLRVPEEVVARLRAG
jgi:predicted metal-dependent phosphoesterase TrpH